MRILEHRKDSLTLASVLWFCVICSSSTAELLNANGGVIRGTESLVLGEGVDLSGLNLFGLRAVNENLTGASFDGTTLTGAEFADTNIVDADFTNASINSGRFDNLSASQLYSTSSYKEQKLRAVRLFDPIPNLGAPFDFRGQDMENAELFGFNGEFREASFADANLVRANLVGDYSSAIWTNASLRFARLNGDFPNADFRGMDFQGATLGGTFEGADFSEAKLIDVDLRTANFRNANFSDAIIDGISIQDGSISRDQLYVTANYQEQDLRGIEFRRRPSGPFSTAPFILAGWNLSEQNLSDARFNSPILVNSNLQDANLQRAHFGAAVATGNDLSNADLSFTEFVSEITFGPLAESAAEISDSNLAGSQLVRANLYGTRIANTDLSNANVAGADFRFAEFHEVDFSGAKLQNASLEFTDLTRVTFSETTEFNAATVFPSGFDPVSAGLRKVETPIGDFDASGKLDARDIDVLAFRLREPVTNTLGNQDDSKPDLWLESVLDLTGDTVVDSADMEELLELANVSPGDANFDGRVDFVDFLALSNNYRLPGGWADGDFDGNGNVNFPDFTMLSVAFGSTDGTTVANVPEPTGAVGLFLLPLVRRRKRQDLQSEVSRIGRCPGLFQRSKSGCDPHETNANA